MSYLTLIKKKNIYEKHLYDKIPLECEARQCYDADYDDSLSPLTFRGVLFHHALAFICISLLSSYCPV